MFVAIKNFSHLFTWWSPCVTSCNSRFTSYIYTVYISFLEKRDGTEQTLPSLSELSDVHNDVDYIFGIDCKLTFVKNILEVKQCPGLVSIGCDY